MQPDSWLWKALEFYGIKVHHPGKWRVHDYLRGVLRPDYDGDLEVERAGLRWRLNPSDFVQTHLYWTGEYEPWDLLHLSRWATPGAVIFDIGANFGYYSLVLGASLRNTGHVFAFEPSFATFARLQANIALNRLESMVTAARCALSDSPGTARLAPVAGNSGANSFSHDQSGEEVTVDTLDHFCQGRGIDRIDLMKIDVEGHELHVLQGGRDTLARCRPVIMMEFNNEALQSAGTSAEELANLLRELGYRLFVAHRRQLAPFQPGDPGVLIANVFCIPAPAAF